MPRTAILFLLLAGTFGSFLDAEPVRDEHVAAELVAANNALVPGTQALLGLRLIHDPHWHSYWKTTATGYASSLDWDIPEGYEAGEIQWVVPEPYDFAGYLEYVYENEILLPVYLTVPEDAQAGGRITLKATAKWLMCEKTCIPGEVELTLSLPIAETAEPNPRWASAFETALDSIPIRSDAISLKAWKAAPETAVLQISGPPKALEAELYFFDEKVFIRPELNQPVTRPEPGVAQISFPIDELGVGETDRFVGVLRTSTSWTEDGNHPGLVVDVPFLEAAPDRNAAASSVDTTPPSAPPASTNLAVALGGAFLGGLILNLMPCVFPVLGIKIMGFVQQAGAERQKVMAHGLVFTAGVLLSFWALAGVLILLRQGGAQLGWGFQLQNPGFVYGLAVFLLLFALNMSGLFEVGNSAIGVGSELTGQSGLSGSFFSGVLATVVATPCAAPFLAPALGAALALPPFQSLIVFTAIALGLSLPYLLLSAFPEWIRKLPRPGAWMESFKQAMAFLLYGTVAFLLWVLAGQLVEASGFTSLALLFVLFGLLVTALAAWIYGRWATPAQKPAIRRGAIAIAGLLLAAGLFATYPRPVFDPASLSSSDAPAVVWEKWEPGKADALAAEGKLVYVDFTARWCVTCQSNKGIVFSSTEVRRFFHENAVVALKADWTNADPEISAALESFGRSAVPFNLVYGPEVETPLELPELLTPGIVLEALNKAG